MVSKIKEFTDLDAWKSAHKLRLEILQELKSFPPDYRYGLSVQMQRAVISVGSNLAEGFGRFSQKERIQFYRIARGSLTELQDQLLVARDMKIIETVRFDELWVQSVSTHKLINGLIRSTPAMFQNSKLQTQDSNLQ